MNIKSAIADEKLCNSIFDELWRECTEQNGAILVAYQRDIFVGFVQYYFEESTNCYEITEVRKYALISNIIVLEDFRHLGFGQILLNAAENAIRATGFTGRVKIGVLANNKQAYIAYQKNGFQKSEIVFEKCIYSM